MHAPAEASHYMITDARATGTFDRQAFTFVDSLHKLRSSIESCESVD